MCYVKKMMHSIDKLMKTMDDLVGDANIEWRLHQELFQVGEYYPVFHDSAPIVWGLLRDALIDSVFMAVSRLLDPAVSCGKENLSFKLIIQRLPDTKQREMEIDYQHVKSQYDSALRDWRNQKLSHNGLLAISGVSPLPGVSYSAVATLIDDINRLAKSLGLMIYNIDQSYRPVISYVPLTPNQDWVWTLMEVLKRGVRPRSQTE